GGVKLKLNPQPDALRGKRVVVVDDSIVRGTTTREVVKMIRESGAAQAPLRIVSPPMRWPCFYRIDMSTREELVAVDRSVDQIQEFVGADSLAYLSLDGVVAATDAPKEAFCRACFDGQYPIPVDHSASKFVLERL